MVFGIPGLSLVLSNLFELSKYRKLNFALIIASIFCITFGLICITSDLFTFTSRFLVCLSIVTLTISLDCHWGKFWNNALLHLVNASYVGVGLYFLFMNIYPELFSDFWQKILVSAPKAFDMLLLCLTFQTIGYYLVWELFYPFTKYITTWSTSQNNLINLSFAGSFLIKTFLFGIFVSLGLVSRLWNLTLGRVYYTEGSGIPFYISSFLAQFERLYFVALLYGCALSFTASSKRGSIVYLTWILVLLELLYQLFSGSKGRFLNFVLLPIASVFVLVCRRISWGILFIVSGTGIFSWLVIYPILVIYRNFVSAIPIEASIEPLKLFSKSSQILRLYPWEKYLEMILTPLNQSGIAEQVTAMTSIIHYQLSQEGSLLWQRLLLFWVPRFLWNEKPAALSANVIGRLSKRLGSEDFTTSVITTAPGELFLYYGLWGALLMILTGLLLRLLNETFSPFKFFTPFRVAVFVSYLPLAQGILSVTFESTLTGIVMQIGTLYFSLILIRIFTRHRFTSY